MKRLGLITLFLLLAGCAGQWVHIRDNGQRQISSSRYDVALPLDWVRRETPDGLIVSRDGPDLQKILLRAVPHDKAFPTIEQTSRPDMLPSDLGARFIAELRAGDSDGLPSLEIEEEGPASLDGHEAFRLRANYRNADGIRFRLLAYGTVTDKGYVELVYVAPAIYYFARNLDDFEAVRASLKLH
ncbi:hypothetical protein [endosymbiont of unidentified scaly snail isolate Monju]|uniref:hypothetical protein n=1 Tax=endosymbiont of unidentified scaly snail isolate Monju TaxID=1248727 RepID=UPI0003892D3D|nr:hypothetical protein [endosymbiont of unidentified scaly snail isolate Monju]BAN70107.1 conserved hypothetical protein [endosymbiont of unidentified scaly snail isolate Monju]